MMRVLLAITAAAALVHGHGDLPINKELGVPGFPDCWQPTLGSSEYDPMDVERNAMTLMCAQRPKDNDDQISVGCVGDSITAGVHSTGGNHTYPGQLQIMLGDGYKVTNLGACGSTLLKVSNSPYWQRPQYKALTSAKWDVIIIMLGTNDAKDPGDGGPNNWLHNCGGVNSTTLSGCTYADDYKSLIDVIKGLGNKPEGPVIYGAIPPPLMQHGSIGANQTVINSVYPKLIPMINKANNLPHDPIDIYTGMGGVVDWQSEFPTSCQLNSPWAPCAWWCDTQSCDQCHPNNNGYTHMASLMKAGIGA